MIDKKIVHNIVRDVLRRKRGLTNHQIMHPEREWFLGLTAALVFLCLSTAWCVGLYNKYSNLSQQNNDGNEATTVVYRANAVAEALDEFATRKQTYADIKTRLLNQKIVVPPPVTVLLPEETATTSTSTTEAASPELTLPEPELIEDPAPPSAETEPEVVPNLSV